MANIYDNDNNDQKIITLDQSQELTNYAIAEYFVFEVNTKNFILDLNHEYKDVRVIWHYNKNWTIMKSICKKECIEKKIQDKHILSIIDSVDLNYNNVTISIENYDTNNNTKQQQQQKDNNNPDDNDKKLYPINKYSQGIPLAESILINNVPYFIQIINEKTILKQQIELSDINIVPPERTEYLSKEYNFSSADEINFFINLAKEETLDSIFSRIRSLWKKYIDIEDDFINLCTADTIFSYFQDKLGMCHYLLIVGDNNTGKSNILLLFSVLGYRALYDTSITSANIYNFCGQLEEGQGMIIEDEIDDIDIQEEKKKLYKVSYRSGTKVTRMYDNNGPVVSNNNNKRKSSRQQAFLLYCFKVFASEKLPDKIKSKGFLERIIPLKSVSGDPSFDISEVVNDAGDKQFKELHEELINTRKLLLMFRLLNYDDPISNIELNIKNRYKQLTKPLIRLFQNSESLDQIIQSLSRYVIEKNEEKINSLDSALIFLVIDLISKHGLTLYNDQIWETIKSNFQGNEIQDKSYSYYSQDYGLISKTKITNICETKFGAKPHRDKEKGRGLIFNKNTLNKLSANYSIINGIKIINQENNDEDNNYENIVGDRGDTCDTSTGNLDINNGNDGNENGKEMTDMTLDHDKIIPQNVNSETKNTNEISTEFNGRTPEVSQVSPLSPNKTEDNESQSIHRRNPNSDTWVCDNCTWTGDKWFMIKHPCKFNKKQGELK